MRIRNVELELHKNEMLSNHIRNANDFYESTILDYLLSHYPTHGVILDIGANIGNHTVFFAEYLKADTILAFEPLVDNFNLLVKNTASYKNVTAIRVAIGERYRVTNMVQNNGNMGASQIHSEGQIDVPMLPLDHFAFGSPITFLKIDVEGYEPQVIEGAYDTIRTWHPLILIEDNNNEYGSLLEGYKLEEKWIKYKTYLYRWEQ